MLLGSLIPDLMNASCELARFSGDARESAVEELMEGVGSTFVERLPAKPGSTEPATRFGCRDTQTGAPLKLG